MATPSGGKTYLEFEHDDPRLRGENLDPKLVWCLVAIVHWVILRGRSDIAFGVGTASTSGGYRSGFCRLRLR